ncbi:MAG: DNA internalization-related competence protein ComEC/Rec2 [Bacilli bacterium]|nr:DNA internalization-related competence protein ComEC/Rec2 [Bacilli bacterium]
MLRLKAILQYSNILLYILIVIIVLSLIRCNIPHTSKYDISDTLIEGIIIDKKKDNDKISFIIKGKEKIKCTYYSNDIDNLELGIKVRLTGTLNEPMNNTIANTFNYKKYLYNNHIYYVMNVDNIEVINNKSNLLYRIKNMIINHINSYKSKGYISMFIIGDKSLLDDGIYNQYQRLGISHIFAISGMHISILSMILFKLLYKLKDKYKYIIVILFLLFYMFITNYSPSVLRSSVMFILLFINNEYDYSLDTIKVYYLSISILLLINPFLLYNVGFLYSSIISYTLIRYGYIIHGNKLISLLKISIISMLVSLPITINSNYEINILSPINNLLFVSLISTIIYPFSLLTFLIKPLDNIFYLLMKLIEVIANYSLVFNIIIPKINIVFIIIYYLILYIFLNTYNKKYLIVLITLLFINKYKYYIDSSYYVTYFDVGQGDSSAIIYKDKVALIDTGGKVNSNYLYTDNIIKYLKSIGQDNIDTLILTHGDYDHMGEAINLVNNYKVEKVIFNCGAYNDLEKELIKVLDDKHINYYSCINNLDNMYFLQTKIYDNENDNSNVIITELNGYKFMFMGDASITTEKEILDKYNLSDIDVLKVGHHGSKTSSSIEFINEINPKYSIISVGKNNRYGHPNKEVLNVLVNSKIYRTDQDGSVMFEIKSNKLKIETCSP